MTWNTGVVLETLTRPQRELQAAFEIKEHHSTVLELGADDSLRRPTETVAIELERLLEIIDRECDE
jgi:hypothetical protein